MTDPSAEAVSDTAAPAVIDAPEPAAPEQAREVAATETDGAEPEAENGNAEDEATGRAAEAAPDEQAADAGEGTTTTPPESDARGDAPAKRKLEETDGILEQQPEAKKLEMDEVRPRTPRHHPIPPRARARCTPWRAVRAARRPFQHFRADERCGGRAADGGGHHGR